MDRRTTLVTAGATALIAVTATAAVAVNTGLLSQPADDIAGTLELPQSVTEAGAETAGPPRVETVYVDVYDQPGAGAHQGVVVVPADATGAPTDAAAAYDQYEDDEEYEEYEEYEDDGEYEEYEEYEDDGEYEGADDDD